MFNEKPTIGIHAVSPERSIKYDGKTGINNVLYNSSVFESEDKFIYTRCFGNEISNDAHKLLHQEYQRRISYTNSIN